MATVQSPATPHAYATRRGVPPLRAGQGHSFLLRKLHSLSGIVPIGAFLIEHLVSNFEALKGLRSQWTYLLRVGPGGFQERGTGLWTIPSVTLQGVRL
jgi:succinate dehydrogenase/fumarate reductase cytochrome b subunit